LFLLWLNSSVQVLDLEIEHELELLQLLSLFLELVNFLFSSSDISILFGDLFFKSRSFFAEFLILNILFTDEEFLVINRSVQIVQLLSNFFKFVLSQLEFGL
jgi:hypothetical protein